MARVKTVTFVTAPPGAGKTASTVSEVVSRQRPAVLSFPTHMNQLTAINYAVHASRSVRRPRVPVMIDYAGMHNYCPLATGELEAVKQFVEKARGKVSGPVAEKYLEKLEEALDMGPEAARLVVNRVVRQPRFCREVCPLGRKTAEAVLEAEKRARRGGLAGPIIVTWRREVAETASKEYVEVWYGNPLREGGVDDMVNARGYCVRAALVAYTATSSGKPVIGTARRIVFTPHAALPTVLRYLAASAKALREHPLVFVDEFDSYMKPVRIPVIPIDCLNAWKQFFEDLAESADPVLSRAGETAAKVLEEIIDRIVFSIESGVYHPLSAITYEALWTWLEETVLATGTVEPLTYHPLGPRPIHVKHFEGTRLLYWLVGKGYRVLREAEEATGKEYVEASGLVPKIVEEFVPETRSYKPVYTLLRDIIKCPPPFRLLHKLLSPLAHVPAFAVYYGFEMGRVWLESIDAKIAWLLGLAKHHEIKLATATPPFFDEMSRGTVPPLTAASDFEALANDAAVSLVSVTRRGGATYASRVEEQLELSLRLYSAEGEKQLEKYLSRPEPLVYDRSLIERVSIPVSIVEVSPETAESYMEIIDIRVVNTPALPPPERLLLTREPEKIMAALLHPYVSLIDELASQGKTVLAAVQNKIYAAIIAEYYEAVPCGAEGCGRPRKLAYWLGGGGRVVITYFRSRAARGVEIREDFDTVVVVGSPNPHPTYPSAQVPDETTAAQQIYVGAYRGDDTVLVKIYMSLIPLHGLLGVNELVQLVGRALRVAYRTGRRVEVYIPRHVVVYMAKYGPTWVPVQV